jgi:hypothetical protein
MTACAIEAVPSSRLLSRGFGLFGARELLLEVLDLPALVLGKAGERTTLPKFSTGFVNGGGDFLLLLLRSRHQLGLAGGAVSSRMVATIVALAGRECQQIGRKFERAFEEAMPAGEKGLESP